MSSPAFGAITLLVNAGLATTDESAVTSSIWLARVGRSLDKPNALINAYDTGGFNPNTKYLLDQPTVQVMVRSEVNDYGGGYAKTQAIKDVLLGLDPQDVNGDRWSGVTMLADTAFLKYDETERALFSLNFRIFLEPPASVLSNRNPL